MSYIEGVDCSLCGGRPRNCVESPCCKKFYCWKCVVEHPGPTVLCQFCKKRIRQEEFTVNEGVNKLLRSLPPEMPNKRNSSTISGNLEEYLGDIMMSSASGAVQYLGKEAENNLKNFDTETTKEVVKNYGGKIFGWIANPDSSVHWSLRAGAIFFLIYLLYSPILFLIRFAIFLVLCWLGYRVISTSAMMEDSDSKMYVVGGYFIFVSLLVKFLL